MTVDWDEKIIFGCLYEVIFDYTFLNLVSYIYNLDHIPLVKLEGYESIFLLIILLLDEWFSLHQVNEGKFDRLWEIQIRQGKGRIFPSWAKIIIYIDYFKIYYTPNILFNKVFFDFFDAIIKGLIPLLSSSNCLYFSIIYNNI